MVANWFWTGCQLGYIFYAFMLSCLLRLLRQCYQSRVWWHMSSFLLLNYLKIVLCFFFYIYFVLCLSRKSVIKDKKLSEITSVISSQKSTQWVTRTSEHFEKTLNVSIWCQYIHLFFNFKVKNIWSIRIFSFDKRHWVFVSLRMT